MKTLKSLLYVFLAAFLFVGCNDDENFNPGEPEDPDCYSVYFPTQENIGSKELDPAAPTEMTFTVRGLKSEGAIVVPVADKVERGGCLHSLADRICRRAGGDDLQHSVPAGRDRYHV